MELTPDNKKNIRAIVIVSALGYFVDIYDLILFSIVRVPSLKSLGILPDAILDNGVLLLNMQMAGMLTGGIIWGILGDKKGRISVLFGSIIMYSIANIANGFVQDIPQYAVMRFVAGIGLAGELGAGITLVCEVMPTQTRGYGTTIVAGIGILGAIAAALVGDYFEWRTAYFVGGVLGLLLLILRIGIYESGMFNIIKSTNIGRGDFLKLFSDWQRFKKYIRCIATGIPLWFVIGILITFSPEFSKVLSVGDTIIAGTSVMFCYIGISAGDFSSGFLSQIMKSRKKVMIIFLSLMTAFILVYLFYNHFGSFYFYTLCLLLGFGAGYWAVFVTNASEQFGTNLRATVTTTVPNFVRGSVVPVTISFQALSKFFGNIITGALIIGMITVILAFISLSLMEETYGKDLNYTDML